jgi:hypothetical protein
MLVPAADGADGSILTGGVYHPGTGFTPLGMSATSGGGASELPFAIAPVYGGLEGHDYIFAVMALSNEGTALRAQLKRSTRLENEQRFDAHLQLPQVEHDANAGTLSVQGTQGVHLVRVMATGADGALRVYMGAGNNGAQRLQPAPGPNGPMQRLARGSVEAINLAGMEGNSALLRLTSGGGMVLSSMGAHATAFARVRFGGE